MRDNSEVLEFVKTHLLTQAQRASEPSTGDCRYRTDGGLTCAVGALITDEHYDAGLEGYDINCSNVRDAVTNSLGFTPDFAMLDQLQTIHDNEPPHRWANLLEQVSCS